MAKVTVQVVGGALQNKEASTVGDLKSQLGLPNHQATVNGESKSDSYTLKDYEYIALAPAVKGAY